MRVIIEEQMLKIRQLEALVSKKDEEIYKLKQDNSALFKDLNKFAQTEEQYKLDLLDQRSKRQELDQLLSDLREKCQSYELKIRH